MEEKCIENNPTINEENKNEKEFDINLFDLIKQSQIKKNISVSRAFNKTLNKYSKNKYVKVNHPCKVIKNNIRHFNLNDYSILKTIFDNEFLKIQILENCKTLEKFMIKVYSKGYLISKKLTRQVFYEISNSNYIDNHEFISKFVGMTQNNKLIFLLYEFNDICKTLSEFMNEVEVVNLIECQ